jgi:gliding motility-associated lipoprotein GldH
MCCKAVNILLGPINLYKFHVLKTISLIVACCCFTIHSCTTTDLYEKNTAIPGHAWEGSFKPSFSFTIRDTSALYNVMLVLRHTEKYAFNNIWLSVSVHAPGDSVRTFRTEKILATNAAGWLGSGMDDIYEHRIPLNTDLAQNVFSFRRPGEYKFTLEQIMRENPLRHVLSAGLRIEKK